MPGVLPNGIGSSSFRRSGLADVPDPIPLAAIDQGKRV
jgi:hypothetical protein